MNAESMIQSAKMGLIMKEPFFATLALRLVFAESAAVDTMATDGAHVYYNAGFVQRISLLELRGVICHEVLHCALGHPWRRDNREPVRWNIAADFAINGILKDSGFALPEGALFPEIPGKSAEWYYDRIQVRELKMPAWGEVADGNGSQGEKAKAQNEWRHAVAAAAQAARERGKLPDTLARFAGLAVKPKVDTRALLARFVSDRTATDYAWDLPNSRYLAQGIYLPRLHSEDLGKVAVIVDTSGSVDGPALARFLGMLNSVVDEARPSSVAVLYADAAVHRTDVFERGDPIGFHPVGGGGTDFRPALEACEKMEEPPVCILYLTDLMGRFPKSCEIPTLWITVCPGAAPFGEVVELQ
jgi:predicted metal-dependent peptidase